MSKQSRKERRERRRQARLARIEIIKEKTSMFLWRTLVAIAVGITVFFIGRSAISLTRSYTDISKLRKEKAMYERSIREDSIIINRLNYDEYIEEYAREKYHMVRDGEEVFRMKEE